jgi:hypothetical protein
VVKRNKSRSNDSCQEAEDSKDLQAFGARALAEDQRAVLAAQRAVVARRAASGHSEEFILKTGPAGRRAGRPLVISVN